MSPAHDVNVRHRRPAYSGDPDADSPVGVAPYPEVVMDQVIVTLDGKDHKIGYGEHTMCMLPVPHGTTREEGAKECKTCFSADDKDEPENPVLSIAVDAESLGSYENPDAVEAEYTEEPVEEKPKAKPAKKATKAG